MIAASTSLKFFKVQFCPVFWQNPGNYSEGCCALLPYQNRTTIHQKHFLEKQQGPLGEIHQNSVILLA